MAVLSSTLPTELVLTIVCIAASRHRTTAARLCLVSRWIRDEVEPILYRVLVLRNAYPDETVGKLYFSKFYTLGSSMAWIHVRRAARGLIQLGRADGDLWRIRNFATDKPSYYRFLHAESLEELHVFSPKESIYIVFPHMRRLHLSLGHFPVTLPCIDNILAQPRLAEIALSIPDDPQSWDITPLIVRLLNEHAPLILLLIRLLPGTSMPPQRGLAYREPIKVQLASICDPRLVVKRVNLAGEHAMIEEWEQNALSGESIWDEAWAELSTSRLNSEAADPLISLSIALKRL